MTFRGVHFHQPLQNPLVTQPWRKTLSPTAEDLRLTQLFLRCTASGDFSSPFCGLAITLHMQTDKVVGFLNSRLDAISTLASRPLPWHQIPNRRVTHYVKLGGNSRAPSQSSACAKIYACAAWLTEVRLVRRFGIATLVIASVILAEIYSEISYWSLPLPGRSFSSFQPQWTSFQSAKMQAGGGLSWPRRWKPDDDIGLMF